MKKLGLILIFLIGSIASAAATCTGPAVMHDFPGTAFNMSLATNAGDGNCASNVAVPDGADVTQGAKADSVWISGAGSVIALLKAVATNTGAAIPAQAASVIIGGVGVPSWAGGTLGAMANYGTSPGAVLVPGVNAFITNPVAVTGTFWQTTQPVSAASLPLPSGAATAANQIVGNNYGNQANWVSGTSGNVDNTTQTTIITAPVAGKLYVTALQCFNSGSTTSTVTLNDGSAWVGLNLTGGGLSIQFPTPLIVGATTALKFTPGSSSTHQFCNAQAYNAT